MVISELPSDQAKKALEALCLPAVTPLQVGLLMRKKKCNFTFGDDV